jgi:glycosyltransferase involved in cell wall biosynthesis
MKGQVTFVHNHSTPFIENDLRLLREYCAVREWYQRTRTVNLRELAAAIRASDLVVGWFASWHTFFPVLMARRLGKRSALFVGGYDTAPRRGSGYRRSAFKQWVSSFILQRATHLIVPSQFVAAELTASGKIPPTRVTTIYHGLDAAMFVPTQPKETRVLTVGNVDTANLTRKGLEPFVRAAAHLLDVPFILVGKWRDGAIDSLRRIATPNVQFTDWVEPQKLADYFSRARVYVQPSRHEGFGLAVAEAMLYQCIPVVTRAGALPEVVGDAGIYAESNKPQDLARAIQHALTLDVGWGERARERIIQEFPMDTRREKIFHLIDRLLADT